MAAYRRVYDSVIEYRLPLHFIIIGGRRCWAGFQLAILRAGCHCRRVLHAQPCPRRTQQVSARCVRY